ncbi:uncharacterized protein LOC133198227 [Saccostrea echinata]|uniref:uncharacterized protein LOC133198227 n=1 Tax=Saccostrea echinata TaxID=191078 RepID=UPI002A836F93|nr:uncharacterized protein LOC133198227 [Saccostrea echinata]
MSRSCSSPPETQDRAYDSDQCTTQVTPLNMLNAETPPFISRQGNMCEEFSKFMVKKDMLLKRIHEFDDRPEFFGSWKSTFVNVVQELNLSPAEEVDLLIQYLGPKSKKSAMSIRSANYSDSSRARDRIWQRLIERYAKPELVESSIKQKLMSLPKIASKEVKKLYELVDIVVEIESLKKDEQYCSLFASYDSSAGVNLIVNKLPYQLQEKWTNEASRYKEQHDLAFPPFHIFAHFLEKMARVKNDPSFVYEDTRPCKLKPQTSSHSVFVKKVDVPVTNSVSETKTSALTICPLHKTNHSLNKCHQFREKSLQDRLEFLRSKGLCFKCCGQRSHLAKDCRSNMMCSVCKATNHPTALHIHIPTHSDQDCNKNYLAKTTTEEVTSACSMVCGRAGARKSCAKTVLVKVYPRGCPEKAVLIYAIVDEQSNRSLARSAFFDLFAISGPEIPYSVSSCNGNTTEFGRRCSDFTIESFDSSFKMDLPMLIECDQIPNIRDEIPSPLVAEQFSHLKDIAKFIPPIQENAEILLLIGRDLLPAHHVLEQCLGPIHAPFAQRLRLGWVIVGNVCLGTAHQQDSISVMKTFTLKDGRTTVLEPCYNNIHVEDSCVFSRTKEDNIPGLSIEDKDFLNLMETEMYKSPHGSWTAPLPFRRNRQHLPNNKPQAHRRAHSLDMNLRKNPEKMEHVIGFMKKILRNGHAEPAQELDLNTECWYLPLFAMYHPKKPGSVRCVFHSSAKYEGISLNDVLLTGPDLVNSLLGILLRFRQHPVAITADIEQMFYRFSVPEKHRDYLRFMRYKDNDPSQDMIEYRMTRHVFGNSPSPAVATCGLRKCVIDAEEDVKGFVCRNFYVDDGLMSFDGSVEAVNLLSRTQTMLKKEGNIRLHKITSNSLDVIKAFPQEDLAKEVTGIKLDLSEAPLQRKLGVSWDISTDSFTFQVTSTHRPFTKRGVLATINGLYDPIGIVAPVTIRGKLIMQDVMSSVTDWDEPIPHAFQAKWHNWVKSLVDLQSILIHVPRCYVNLSSSEVERRKLHVFSDASQRAISAVAYLKICDVSGGHHVSFVHGKARVAPSQGHTIPRLELCAAVLATRLKDTITQHLTVPIDSITMYTDSRVVLGYINNEHRRFYVYVGNRIDMIRHSTTSDQWTFVSSEDNPADIGTRSIPANEIEQSAWIQGPSILRSEHPLEHRKTSYELIDPEEDKEVRPVVIVTKKSSAIQETVLGIHRFERFSTWRSLVRAKARIKCVAKSYRNL